MTTTATTGTTIATTATTATRRGPAGEATPFPFQEVLRMSATTTVLPPIPLPAEVTFVLVPAPAAAPSPTIGTAPLGWPEGEPTWEDAEWQ